MPRTFAHSERNGKPIVRGKRRDDDGAPHYIIRMKLRIDELRRERGLTVEALAEKAGISKSYLSEMMNGKKPINSNRLAALAQALRVSPVELIDENSIPEDVMTHLRVVSRLSPADRLAVFRHAEGLANSEKEAQ